MCLAPATAAMAEAELQEADVLWPDHHHSPDNDRRYIQRRQQKPHCWSVVKKPSPRVDDDDDAARGRGSQVPRPASLSAAAPVAIIPGPSWAQDDEDEDEVAFVPPHVALEARRRRSEGRAALSMCEGLGRTLKGRDLQTVRTAVLRRTGFIET